MAQVYYSASKPAQIDDVTVGTATVAADAVEVRVDTSQVTDRVTLDRLLDAIKGKILQQNFPFA